LERADRGQNVPDMEVDEHFLRPLTRFEVQMTEFANDSVSIDVVDDGTIVVKGDIDMAGAPLLEASILQVEDHRPVVLDLEGVFFIDSSGLRSLLDAARRALGRGTDVVLRSVGPEVSRLLEITGTSDQFRIDTRRA
jgi:anti-anti-sigma factor